MTATTAQGDTRDDGAWPRISLVTPNRNHARFLEQCLDSVLGQSYPNLQYIVRDGGSTDGSVEILRDRGDRITWTSVRDAGQAAAINAGLRQCDGAIVGWLNSDDYHLGDTLRTVARCFADHPEAVMIHGRAWMVDERGGRIRPYPTFDFARSDLSRKCYVCQPTVFLRRSALDAIGLLNERLDICFDYEWWLRIVGSHPVVFCPEYLAASRQYAQTKTASRRLRGLVEAGYLQRMYFGRASWRWSAKWVVRRWALDRRRYLCPPLGWIAAAQSARRYRRRFDDHVAASLLGRRRLGALDPAARTRTGAAASSDGDPAIAAGGGDPG